MFGSVWVVRNAKNPAQKKILGRGMAAIWSGVVIMILVQIIVGILSDRQHWTTHTYALVEVVNYTFFMAVLLAVQVNFFGHHHEMRCLTATGKFPPPDEHKDLFSGFGGLFAWAGMMVGGLGWLVDIAWNAGDSLAVAIVMTVGAVAIAWPIVLSASMGHAAAARSVLSQMPAVLMYGVILLMLNWRLDLWIAVRNGRQNPLSLSEVNSILPMWIVHAATALLLLWVGALLLMTKPKQPAIA